MESDTALQIGRLDGRLDGVNEAITSLQSQISDIHGSTHRIEERQVAVVERLDRMLGSGPQPAIRAPQAAIEHSTDLTTKAGAAKAILNSKNLPHLIWGIVLILSLVASYAMWSGRPASDFMPSTGAVSAPSSKPTTREGVN